MLGKHTLAPGEQTELEVTYLTQGLPGPFDKKVFFSTSISGEERIEVFRLSGYVREAPGAKIAVAPRRVVIDGDGFTLGKKQVFSVKNEGSLPLIIKNMRSKDGENVYYDGAKDGHIAIEPGKTLDVELQLRGRADVTSDREMILVDSNAINAGSTGLFLMIEYNGE